MLLASDRLTQLIMLLPGLRPPWAYSCGGAMVLLISPEVVNTRERYGGGLWLTGACAAAVQGAAQPDQGERCRDDGDGQAARRTGVHRC